MDKFKMPIVLIVGVLVLVAIIAGVLFYTSRDDDQTTSPDSASDNNNNNNNTGNNNGDSEQPPVIDRNNGRLSDIISIRTAILEYAINNNDKIPTTQAVFETMVRRFGLLSHYTLPATSLTATSTTPQVGILFAEPNSTTIPASAVVGIDELHIWRGATCNLTAGATTYGATAGGSNVVETGSSQQVAIVYKLEADDNIMCQDFLVLLI